MSVTYHQHIFVHDTLLSVQRYELLSFLRIFDDNLVSCQRIQIIGVHRLSVFFHYIVRNVNQIVNRTNSDRRQSSLHPFRRRSDFYIFYNPCTIAGAKLRIFHGNFHVIIDILIISCLSYNRWSELLAKCCGSLSGDSDYTVAVYAVRCNLIFKYYIMQPEHLNGICSNFHIIVENVDSVFRRLRVHLFVRAKFLDRAHHTKALHSTEFAFFNFDSACYTLSRLVPARYTAAICYNRNFRSLKCIGCPCHNLKSLCSNVYLTDYQLIRIRVLFNLVNLSDNNFVQIGI